jgi:hypothetical protein
MSAPTLATQRCGRVLVILLAATSPTATLADTIRRCVAADGSTTYQQMRCAPGSRETETRQVAPARPAPTRAPREPDGAASASRQYLERTLRRLDVERADLEARYPGVEGTVDKARIAHRLNDNDQARRMVEDELEKL